MYRTLLFLYLLLSTTTLFSQKKNFAIGFQSAINYSRTVITNEFDNSPLRSDYFIGSSFGIVVRQKLGKAKWQWGPFTENFTTYVEYGVNAAYGGYNYSYDNQITFQEQLTFSVPILLVLRANSHRIGFRGKFKDKRNFFVSRTGFSFNHSPANKIQLAYTFGEATYKESVIIDPKINLAFVGAFGFQKEYRNGRIMYIGFSAHTLFGVRTKGTVEVNSAQINEIAQLQKTGLLFSIDLQYFIGKQSEDKREGNRKRRKKKRGKLPKIIYNPRYY